MTIRINGIGTSLPEKILTNDDLSTMMETSDGWIRARAGIGSAYAEDRVGAYGAEDLEPEGERHGLRLELGSSGVT